VTVAELSTDQKTDALLDAFPYICEFVGKTIVVKVGGSVGDEGVVLDDIVWLKRRRLAFQSRKENWRRQLRCRFRRHKSC